MTITLVDPRLALWRRRKIEQDRLATLRIYRASICGLSCCNDADKGEELDSLIAQTIEWLAEISDRICVHAHQPAHLTQPDG